jgi:Death domain
MYRKGEIRLTDIARLLGSDWPSLAAELELTEEEVTKLMDEYGENAALHMLRYWLKSRGSDATGKEISSFFFIRDFSFLWFFFKVIVFNKLYVKLAKKILFIIVYLTLNGLLMQQKKK